MGIYMIQLSVTIYKCFNCSNPTPVKDSSLENIIWPKVSNLSQVDYLDFDTKLKVLQNPKNENYAFWMDLYYKKGRPTTTL